MAPWNSVEIVSTWCHGHCCTKCSAPSYPWKWTSQSISHVATGGQSVSQTILMSCPRWSFWPDIISQLTVAVLPLWDVLSGERTGLPFVAITGSSNKSIARVEAYLHIYMLDMLWNCICNMYKASVSTGLVRQIPVCCTLFVLRAKSLCCGLLPFDYDSHSV